MNHQALAHALLRVSVGVMFLCYGIGKFRVGLGQMVAGMVKRFEGKLPEFMVQPFATTLPFIEVVVGTLLILGLFTRWALVAASVLMMGLLFGAVMEPNPATVGVNVMYAFILSALLFTVDHNAYSVDAKFRRQR
jgi:thiosulfate dehydrogenase [quinone] large subunit